LEKNPQVDQYIEVLAPDRKAALEKIRTLILTTVPEIKETMQYRMPTYELGEVVCAAASQKHYVSLYMDKNTAVSLLTWMLEKAASGLKKLKTCRWIQSGKFWKRPSPGSSQINGITTRPEIFIQGSLRSVCAAICAQRYACSGPRTAAPGRPH